MNINENDIKFFKDKAITTINKDKLGRSKFVDRLYELIKKCNTSKTSFTIDINGKWGDGKTSIINLLKEKFSDKEDKNYTFIDFDVWKVSANKENIDNEIYLQIFDKIKYFKNKDNFDYGFLLLSRFINKFRQLLIFMLICTIFANFKEFVNIISDKIERILVIVTAFWGFIKYYHHIIGKKDILKSLLEKTKNEKYIIVIDDFDRLEQEEICNLISFIKSNLDLPNLIFIFVYDRNIINAVLKEQYKYDNFLEKIVNCQLDVPQIKERYLVKFLENEIERINLKNFDNYRYSRCCKDLLPYYFTNIRKIKRFLNQFSNDYNMLINTEIDGNDFLFIEIIKHFEFDLYCFIMNNEKYFTKYIDEYYRKTIYFKENGHTNMDVKTNNEKINLFITEMENEIIKSITNKNALKIFKNILEIVFPNMGKEKLSNGSDETENSNRICSPKSFYKYFQLDLNIEDFTKSEYDDIINYKSFENFVKNFKNICNEKIKTAAELKQEVTFEELKESFIDSQYVKDFKIKNENDLLISLYLQFPKISGPFPFLKEEDINNDFKNILEKTFLFLSQDKIQLECDNILYELCLFCNVLLLLLDYEKNYIEIILKTILESLPKIDINNQDRFITKDIKLYYQFWKRLNICIFNYKISLNPNLSFLKNDLEIQKLVFNYINDNVAFLSTQINLDVKTTLCEMIEILISIAEINDELRKKLFKLLCNSVTKYDNYLIDCYKDYFEKNHHITDSYTDNDTIKEYGIEKLLANHNLLEEFKDYEKNQS